MIGQEGDRRHGTGPQGGRRGAPRRDRCVGRNVERTHDQPITSSESTCYGAPRRSGEGTGDGRPDTSRGRPEARRIDGRFARPEPSPRGAEWRGPCEKDRAFARYRSARGCRAAPSAPATASACGWQSAVAWGAFGFALAACGSESAANENRCVVGVRRSWPGGRSPPDGERSAVRRCRVRDLAPQDTQPRSKPALTPGATGSPSRSSCP